MCTSSRRPSSIQMVFPPPVPGSWVNRQKPSESVIPAACIFLSIIRLALSMRRVSFPSGWSHVILGYGNTVHVDETSLHPRLGPLFTFSYWMTIHILAKMGLCLVGHGFLSFFSICPVISAVYNRIHCPLSMAEALQKGPASMEAQDIIMSDFPVKV